MIHARKFNKISEFYAIFARKVPEFYTIIARKSNFFPDVWGGERGGSRHVYVPPASLSPTPMV